MRQKPSAQITDGETEAWHWQRRGPRIPTKKRLDPWSSLLFFPFSVAPWRMEFPGQGSDLSHSCDLSCSCSNAKSLTDCTALGIEPRVPGSQDTTHPLASQQELLGVLLCCSELRIWQLSLQDLGHYRGTGSNPCQGTFTRHGHRKKKGLGPLESPFSRSRVPTAQL